MTCCDLPPNKPPAVPPACGADEPHRPRFYCAELADFLDRRAVTEFALVSYARKPSHPTRDAAMLGRIFWLRGQTFNRT